jgi:hypothetical protein
LDFNRGVFILLAQPLGNNIRGVSMGSLPMSFAKWLRLPSRIAVLLGMGALSATSAQPARAEPELGKGPMRVPQQSAKSFGEVLIWSEGERIYLCESGNEPRELRLGDTPQAQHLKELLAREGAVAEAPRVLQHRLILVGGGGSAIHWSGAQSSNASDNSGRAPGLHGSNRAASPPTKKPPAQAEDLDRAKVAGAPKQN